MIYVFLFAQLTAPIFDFDKPIEIIGDEEDEYGINIPVPHAFTKSVLAETKSGKLKLWTFVMENRTYEPGEDENLGDFRANTYNVEQYVGGKFWPRIEGRALHRQKSRRSKMWDH